MIQRTLFKDETTTRQTGASFSDCLRYRWTLWRSWGVGKLVNFVMLNPSTANATDNDPTVERCERRAVEWGYGGLIVTNLFAFRATDPRDMRAQADPVGTENDAAIIESACQSEIVVCAWGNHGSFTERSLQVKTFLRRRFPNKLHVLRISKTGEPAHPLYLPYNLKPQVWE